MQGVMNTLKKANAPQKTGRFSSIYSMINGFSGLDHLFG